MQQSFSLTGKDTIQIANKVMNNLAEGDVFTASYPNDLVSVKTGKDGNSIFTVNSMGQLVEATLRVLRGSPDDKFLNGLYALQVADLPSFPLMGANLSKRIGDGQGGVKRDQYILAGGVFTKAVAVTSNVEGTTDQAVAVYTFKFALSQRAIL